MRRLSLFLISILACFSIFAEDVKISGTVISASDGEPLIGASVSVKGTQVGVATDIDGNFTVTAPTGSKLTISYIGYSSAVYNVVGAAKDLTIELREDSQMLDELVVVGYGVQKKSVVTAAISSVDSEALSKTSPVRIDNALKGMTSGVTVTSASGQPGDAARVRIRGIGTINDSDPLYIVDGMPIEGGADAIDYLNPNDIQSVEVLKDAASGAVYGARAANGVILITTKSGQQGKVKVNYDFSYGWQSAWKKRSVLNATEYAVLMNEGSLNAGMAAPYSDPYSYGEGFDWQSAVFNDNAPVQNHQLSISGANDKVNYFLSAGYYSQEGIVGGNFDRSNYERMTLRSNTVYTLFDKTKQRNWLNKMTVTVNASYARIKSRSIETNSTWGSVLGSALSISPILTPYLEGAAAQQQIDYYAGNPNYVPLYGSNGLLLTNPEVFGNYQEMANPIANLSLPGSLGWSHKFVGNFIGELQIWDTLKYRISYGADLSFYGYDGYTQEYYLRSGASQTFSTAYSQKSQGTVWQLENTLSYDKRIDLHNFSILLGQSAKESSGSYLYGSRNYIIDYNRPYIDASTGQAANGDMSSGGAPYAKSKLASLFGRVSYDYDSRYMAQFTIRRDGSSRFGSNNHWATFPSFSLGWNITNEPYMQNHPQWWNNGKIRFSWGKNGNESIGDFLYLALASTGNNAIFGKDETIVIGTKPSLLPNKNLKWEESTQTDIGFDLGFLNNSLTFTFDYYKKITDGMLMSMSVPSYVGETVPVGNVGKMENSGVEMEANYHLNYGDWTFGVGGNISYLKNKLIEYGNEEGWANLDSFQGVGTITRAENGEPFPFFYGYKTDGLFQTQAEADEYNALYGDTAVAGDVRFVDVNGDGVIDDNDRTKIGKGMPDWTYGFNFSVEWKGIALNAMFQGTIGNDIFDATRRVDAVASNLPSWMLGRWTGEGTSNRIPRYVRGDSRNWKSSDLYIYDGDYMRLKNLVLSYTFPHQLTRKIGVESFRVYGSAENLLTFTKYHGYDPEISSGGTSLGIDYGVYPQARVFSLGFNIQF